VIPVNSVFFRLQAKAVRPKKKAAILKAFPLFRQGLASDGIDE
jgi:hypothetical protein